MKRLTPATLTIAMLFVVGLLVTGYVAKRVLGRDTAPAADPVITVPMPLSDLEPGTVITEGHVALGRMRESQLTPETIRSDRVLIGRVVREPLQAARPIRTTDLYPPGEYPPLQLEPGMRAVSVSLDDSTSAVDGLVRAGHYVDVHFTPSSYRGQDRTGGLTMTLFRGVQVLAINRNMGGGSGATTRGGSTVTLKLSHEQANILIQARDKGSLTLTYTTEGPGDGGVALSRDDRATLNEILGLERPFTTEIYYGGGRNVLEFQNGRPVGSPTINYGRLRTQPVGTPASDPAANVRPAG